MKPVDESLLVLANSGTTGSQTQPDRVVSSCLCVKECFGGVEEGMDIRIPTRAVISLTT